LASRSSSSSRPPPPALPPWAGLRRDSEGAREVGPDSLDPPLTSTIPWSGAENLAYGAAVVLGLEPPSPSSPKRRAPMTDPYLPPEAIELPITDELDLHPFRPRDMGTLVPDYLQECRERGINPVRVVHGKGTGQLRKGLHKLLDRLPFVERYELCGRGHGAWGATRVWLRPAADPGDPTP
jgi:hypothetical protein